MINFLSHPAWQGIGSIAGIVSIVISLLLANDALPQIHLKKYSWRFVAAILSLVLPAYTIFVVSIILVNQFTQSPQTVLYVAVALSSILGVIWGIMWAIYIRTGLLKKNIQSIPKSEEGQIDNVR